MMMEYSPNKTIASRGLRSKPLPGNWSFHEGELDAEDVKRLLDQHFAEMRAGSPPSACHVLPADALKDEAIRFVTLRRDSVLMGFGALRILASDHGEIKSMRTSDLALGLGAGTAVLDRLTAMARDMGLSRLSLETGSTPSFAAALRLYQRDGFRPCGPFAGYRDAPFTRFFTKSL